MTLAVYVQSSVVEWPLWLGLLSMGVCLLGWSVILRTPEVWRKRGWHHDGDEDR